MAPPRDKVNKVEFRMEQGRMNDMTVDEMTAIGDIMAQSDNAQVLIQNTRHLRTFLGRFVWDGSQYLEQGAAWDVLGPMRYAQMMEAIKTIFEQAEEIAVPPTSEPESGSA